MRLALCAAMMAGAALSAQAPPQKIVVSSPTLKADETMPRDYTPDGRNMSPPLTWSNLPGATKEIAVVCEDPDAGNPPPFVHWVIYKIPGTAKGLPESVPMGANVTASGIAGAINGLSGFNAFQRPGQPPLEPGYRGPSPPAGMPHHYHFTVYALNAPLDVKEGLDKAALLKAMDGKIAAQGEIVGVYQR